jgi:protein SCO1/2
MKRRHALAVLAASLASACTESRTQFNAIDLTGADYAKDFRMPDAEGRVRGLADFKGQVVAVFFGFTQCPDVCPTTLAELAEAKKQLGAKGEKVQVVFVTVDPERDTPELLKAYMVNFDPRAIALRGTPEQLAEMAKDFKVYYKKIEGKTPGTYTMDHSAATYIYDPQGRLRLYSRYGSGPQSLASDIGKLLDSA